MRLAAEVVGVASTTLTLKSLLPLDRYVLIRETPLYICDLIHARSVTGTPDLWGLSPYDPAGDLEDISEPFYTASMVAYYAYSCTTRR